MMMNATFVVVFWSSYETKAEANDEHAWSFSFTFFSCIAKNNDEPSNLSTFSTTQEKNKHTIDY
jgi:hypothetical protein